MRPRTAFLYYNGNYNRKNLWKPKIFIFGTKPHPYELIFHPHIEEGQTKVVCFIKKINMIEKKLRNLGFKNFAVTMDLNCSGLNLKSWISKKNVNQIDFFYKTDYLSLTFLYMWVKYELIWMMFSAGNANFRFSEIFPIVIPIVIQKCGARPQNSGYKLFFLGFWSIW